MFFKFFSEIFANPVLEAQELSHKQTMLLRQALIEYDNTLEGQLDDDKFCAAAYWNECDPENPKTQHIFKHLNRAKNRIRATKAKRKEIAQLLKLLKG